MWDKLDRVAEVWYTETGNIKEIANASGVIQNKYWYDDLGQLRREDNRATGRTYLFNYDNAGNKYISDEKYYSLPWEITAESFGEVHRSIQYVDGAQTRGNIYYKFLKRWS